jgi:hypothetical protein
VSYVGEFENGFFGGFEIVHFDSTVFTRDNHVGNAIGNDIEKVDATYA